MKVLLVFREEDTDNLFVQTLYEGIKKEGVDIECSIAKFWNSDTFYDIIHFQWPEEVVGWNCTDMQVVEKLQTRIDFLKSKGSKVVYTRHNVCPHYSNKAIGKAYSIIETRSNIVVHMGNFSYSNFIEKYPESQNVIIPHHIYEQTYNETISKEEARNKLKIKKNKIVITAFGKFRNLEESKMIFKAFLRLNIKNKYLLAPRIFPFHKTPQHSSMIKRSLSWAGYHWVMPFLKFCNVRGGAVEELITNEDLPYYIIASDIIIVQRKYILNSGNVPLGFLFKKVVVGPDVGNVGEILRLTGNPTFDPHNIKSIATAIDQACQLSQKGYGLVNYQYAMTHYNLKTISEKYIDCYTRLIDNKHSETQ